MTIHLKMGLKQSFRVRPGIIQDKLKKQSTQEDTVTHSNKTYLSREQEETGTKHALAREQSHAERESLPVTGPGHGSSKTSQQETNPGCVLDQIYLSKWQEEPCTSHFLTREQSYTGPLVLPFSKQKITPIYVATRDDDNKEENDRIIRIITEAYKRFTERNNPGPSDAVPTKYLGPKDRIYSLATSTTGPDDPMLSPNDCETKRNFHGFTIDDDYESYEEVNRKMRQIIKLEKKLFPHCSYRHDTAKSSSTDSDSSNSGKASLKKLTDLSEVKKTYSGPKTDENTDKQTITGVQLGIEQNINRVTHSEAPEEHEETPHCSYSRHGTLKPILSDSDSSDSEKAFPKEPIDLSKIKKTYPGPKTGIKSTPQALPKKSSDVSKIKKTYPGPKTGKNTDQQTFTGVGSEIEQDTNVIRNMNQIPHCNDRHFTKKSRTSVADSLLAKLTMNQTAAKTSNSHACPNKSSDLNIGQQTLTGVRSNIQQNENDVTNVKTNSDASRNMNQHSYLENDEIPNCSYSHETVKSRTSVTDSLIAKPKMNKLAAIKSNPHASPKKSTYPIELKKKYPSPKMGKNTCEQTGIGSKVDQSKFRITSKNENWLKSAQTHIDFQRPFKANLPLYKSFMPKTKAFGKILGTESSEEIRKRKSEEAIKSMKIMKRRYSEAERLRNYKRCIICKGVLVREQTDPRGADWTDCVRCNWSYHFRCCTIPDICDFCLARAAKNSSG